MSEGGLAVGLAEMAIAGGLGADVTLDVVPSNAAAAADFVLLFSESPSRFLLEVRPECLEGLNGLFEGLPVGRLGFVTSGGGDGGTASSRLIVRGDEGSIVIECSVADLKTAWQRPLRDL